MLSMTPLLPPLLVTAFPSGSSNCAGSPHNGCALWQQAAVGNQGACTSLSAFPVSVHMVCTMGRVLRSHDSECISCAHKGGIHLDNSSFISKSVLGVGVAFANSVLHICDPLVCLLCLLSLLSLLCLATVLQCLHTPVVLPWRSTRPSHAVKPSQTSCAGTSRCAAGSIRVQGLG